ncbi:MAG TPA: hypothetical protein VJS20_08715, partial [Gemmatimonadales bacterium]|nr:hypothetical protein [Gemmatimonadales bacterium]
MADSTRPPLRILALLLGLAACEHTEPFAASATPILSGPLSPGNPTRLTYNLGEDAYPVSAPDGSYLLYQAENPDQLDRDRCLFLLPPTGGTQTLEACDQTVPSEDSTNVFG